MHIIDINASSLSAVLKPAGLDNSKGVISVGYVKDPADPSGRMIKGTKPYLAFMAKYYPEGDEDRNLNVYGYITAQLLVQVLKNCGDDLTRDNVMKQAAGLTNVELDLLLPGIAGDDQTPSDYRVNKQFQMVRFDGERWEKLADRSSPTRRKSEPEEKRKTPPGIGRRLIRSCRGR